MSRQSIQSTLSERVALPVFTPRWSAPPTIVALTTTTAGGVSEGDWATLNLGTHVGDNPMHVGENRRRLQSHIGDAVQLCWLRQTHSDIIIDADNYSYAHATGGSDTDTEHDSDVVVVEGDASTATQTNRACVVMTADCLPVLLCNATGTRVAALHCGWKGLHHDLIGKTLTKHFGRENVIAWLGPAIGKASYEVDDGLYQRFVAQNRDYAAAFTANRAGHYLLDLYAIARLQLQRANVAPQQIFGGDFDTLTDARCFSHRRSPNSGRMASVIFIAGD